MRHQIVRLLFQLDVVAFVSVFFLLNEQSIDELFQGALVVLRVLFVVLGAQMVQVLQQVVEDWLEAN